MKCFKFATLALGITVALWTCPRALAQYPSPNPNSRAGFGGTNPYYRPPYSPYLNLLRPGNPAINYYGLVRPQQENQVDFHLLQNQTAFIQQNQFNQDAIFNQVITGNRGQFLNYQRYFLNNATGGPGVARFGTTIGSQAGQAQAQGRGANQARQPKR